MEYDEVRIAQILEYFVGSWFFDIQKCIYPPYFKLTWYVTNANNFSFWSNFDGFRFWLWSKFDIIYELLIDLGQFQ